MRNQRMNMTQSSYFYSPGDSCRKDKALSRQGKALFRQDERCEDFSSALNRMAETLARMGYSDASDSARKASFDVSLALVDRNAPSATVS